MRFSDDDRARVAQAIATAERDTSGEIFCVFTRRVSSHVDVVLAWAGFSLVMLPLLGLLAKILEIRQVALRILVQLTFATDRGFRLIDPEPDTAKGCRQ